MKPLFSNSAEILGQHDIVVLADVPVPPPPKVGLCPICNFSNLFPLKWLRMTQNGQFCPIHNFSNLYPLKWLRMTQNGQFCPIRSFSNLFPPKWLRMTRNGQFAHFATFPIFSHRMAQNDLEWPILPQLATFLTWNGQFCPIHNFSNLSYQSTSE